MTNFSFLNLSQPSYSDFNSAFSYTIFAFVYKTPFSPISTFYKKCAEIYYHIFGIVFHDDGNENDTKTTKRLETSINGGMPWTKWTWKFILTLLPFELRSSWRNNLEQFIWMFSSPLFIRTWQMFVEVLNQKKKIWNRHYKTSKCFTAPLEKYLNEQKCWQLALRKKITENSCGNVAVFLQSVWSFVQ